MKAIPQENTRPELLFRRALFRSAIRGYRVSNRSVLGRPDILFTRQRVAIFVDGCFWHGCPLCYSAPRTNAAFWREKLAYNMTRDARNTDALQKEGWKVLRVWEHEVNSDVQRLVSVVTRLLSEVTSS